MENGFSPINQLKSILTQYGSTKEMIESQSKDPSNLIDLFRQASPKNVRELQTDDHLINEIFDKIDLLASEGKLDQSQIKTVIKIASNIYPEIDDNNTLKLATASFLNKHISDDKLDAENVTGYLKYARRMNANENVQKCLDFIQKEMGIKLVEKESSLSIEIVDPRTDLEELSKQLTALSKIYGKTEITFSPKATESLPAIEKFIKTHGQSIRSLNLDNLENEINDEFIQNTTNYCPNLYHIFIKSNKITSEGVEKLSRLQSLSSIDLTGCYGLTELPDNLPAGLTTLNLSSAAA